MSYTANITTKNPTAIVVMVDQSGSMSEQIIWNNLTTTKADAVAEAVNNLLEELVARSRSESHYRHYFDIMGVGYYDNQVRTLFDSGDSYFMSPAQLVGSVQRTRTIQREHTMPDGRKITTKREARVWVEPYADGRTPMRAAFMVVYDQLRRWLRQNPDSFPPIIFNITDGEATDSSPEKLQEIVASISSLSTSDGSPLVINIHLSRLSDSSILFPSSKSELPQDKYAHLLFDISSKMPKPFDQEIALLNGDVAQGEYYGMAFNASISDLVRMLNVGSTTINKIVSL